MIKVIEIPYYVCVNLRQIFICIVFMINRQIYNSHYLNYLTFTIQVVPTMLCLMGKTLTNSTHFKSITILTNVLHLFVIITHTLMNAF